MRYRRATSDDASQLAAMNRRLIRDQRHRNPMSDDELHARMRGWLAGAYQAVVFEDEQDVPVGYALFRLEPDFIYLRQFFVEAARRRQGIGRAAIACLVKHHWQNRSRIQLDVLAGNSAGIAFWRSVGFVEYAITMERDI